MLEVVEYLREVSEIMISTRTTKKIIRRINAYSPNPGAWFELEGKRIKIMGSKPSMKTTHLNPTSWKYLIPS